MKDLSNTNKTNATYDTVACEKCKAIIEGKPKVELSPVTLAFIEALRTAQEAARIANTAADEWCEEFHSPQKAWDMVEKITDGLIAFENVIWELMVEHMKDKAIDYSLPDVYASKL